MQFFWGLLPGLLIGIALGLTGTAIARHTRPVAKVLVKAAIVTGAALGKLLARARARFAGLVAEARAELAQAAGPKDAEPPPGPWAGHDISPGEPARRDEPLR